MADFKYNPNRDASHVIRGYVYQVYLTIERWLQLEENQELILESGEDIDIVSSSLKDETTNVDRILEQVKHLETTVTLKSQSAYTSIINFIKHKKSNPDLNLYFRYTTNSKPAVEKLSPFTGKIPAIIAWEDIRLNRINDELKNTYIVGIRSILKNLIRPEKISEEDWKDLVNLLGENQSQELEDLINRFEWSTGQSEFVDIEPKLLSIMISRGFSEDRSSASFQITKLFLYVFKVLCEKGSKSLSVEDRDRELSMQPLSDADEALYSRLSSYINEIEKRVSKIESVIDLHSKKFSSIEAEVAKIVTGESNKSEFQITETQPMLDIPPQLTRLSARKNNVLKIHEKIKSHTWTHLYGIAGSGKTQISIQTINSYGNCIAWLRFRNHSDLDAAQLFDSYCTQLSGTVTKPSRRLWYSEICIKLQSNSIIVLDDLPKLLKDELFTNRLILFSKACSDNKIKILTTGSIELPSVILEILGSDNIEQIKAPEIEDDEAEEIFKYYEAPKDLKTKTINSLAIVANRHAQLITAMARYLKDNKWNFDLKIVEGVFGQGYASEINQETIKRLVKTVGDNMTRDFLYRLKLNIGVFSEIEIGALANVTPKIERPFEHIDMLLGLWLQQDRDQIYTISPLIKALKDSNLHADVKLKCYHSLGNLIVKKKQLNKSDILKAVIYFINANEENEASSILIIAFIQLDKSQKFEYAEELISIWSTVLLPESIKMHNRIMLRGLQIRFMSKLEEDVKFLLTDLSELMERATDEEAFISFYTIISVLPLIVSDHIIIANHLLIKIFEFYPNLKLPDGNKVELPDEFDLNGLIWINSIGVRTPDEVLSWYEAFEKMPAEYRKVRPGDNIAEAACIFVTEMPWLYELEFSEKHDWDAVLSDLKIYSEKAIDMGLELLWACVVRSIIIVKSELLNDLDGALLTVEAAISNSSDDPRVQYVLKDAIGRQLSFKGQNSDARKWLLEALALGGDSFPGNRIYTLLAACKVSIKADPQEAVEYTEKAVRIAQDNETLVSTDLLEALGERSIAISYLKDDRMLFDSLEETVQILLEFEADDERWKSLFIQIGHISGYYNSMASTGKPPTGTMDGSEYVEPYCGFLSNQSTKIAEQYKPYNKPLIYAQMAMFADLLGLEQQVLYWSSRGLDEAIIQNNAIAISELSILSIPSLIVSGKYDEAFDHALKSGIYLVGTYEANKRGEEYLHADFDPYAILGTKPNDHWNRAEYHALILFVSPVFVQIAHKKFVNDKIWIKLLEEMISQLNQVKETASDRYLWSTLITLFEGTFSYKLSSAELKKRSLDIDSTTYQLLRVLYLMGSTIQEKNLKQVLVDHISILQFLESFHKPNSVVYGSIVQPFFVEYWMTTFTSNRMLFQSPMLIESEMKEALDKSGDEQLHFILNSMLFGLNIVLPEDVMQWLSPK